MKKFYKTVFVAVCLIGYQFANAQCSGIKGPNLLGAKGTFSQPYIVANTSAAFCAISGSNTYSPTDNVGNKLVSCSGNTGNSIPCSDYPYTSASGGLGAEFTYSIVRTIGNAAGGNCLKGDWRGSDHTGDGGYFMAVNGAPNNKTNPIFYKILAIPVCIGTTYEFSAYVLNILPSSSTAAVAGSEPNVSFQVNGTEVVKSNAILYTATPTWVKVSGTFTATTNTVDLQVVNNTSVATGNDLGLDDISINVCQSQIAVNGPDIVCPNSALQVVYTANDPNSTNTWYKVQRSTDGGAVFADYIAAAQGVYTSNNLSYTLNVPAVTTSMNNYKYRFIVSTSLAGLNAPTCTFFNDYTLVVPTNSQACGPLPVKLMTFEGSCLKGISKLHWQTSQEINNDHFELFKSYDLIDFVSVTKITAKGNSNIIKNYNYQDQVGGSNYVYYRLKQVDINGGETFSEIIKVSLGSKGGVEVFPNPFNNTFTINIGSSKTTFVTLNIQNTSGQVVYTKNIAVNKGNNSNVISNLPTSLKAGTYYVTVSNDERNYSTKLQKL